MSQEVIKALRDLEAAASNAVNAKTTGQEQRALFDLVKPTIAARHLLSKLTAGCGQCAYVRAFHNDPERFCSSTCATKAEKP